MIGLHLPSFSHHPLLQRKLLQVFIKRSQTNQFFLTTQSPIFCQYREDRVKPYLVRKEAYSTIIKELAADDMNEIKSILGHVNTDLFGYNAVLFVEGDSEFKTIPLLASNLSIDIVNDGIRIVDSEGYGNMRLSENKP
jgi:predicted ATP-dependent endonuclease of OLD family